MVFSFNLAISSSTRNDGLSSMAIIFHLTAALRSVCVWNGQSGFWFNQNVAFISSPVYVDATIYYPRQFCVPFNLVTLLFYLYLCLCMYVSPAPDDGRILLSHFETWCHSSVVFSSSFECARMLCVSHSLQMKLNLFAIFLMVIVVTAVCSRPISLSPTLFSVYSSSIVSMANAFECE